MDATTQQEYYLNGLQFYIQKEILMRRPTTLQDAMCLAENAERAKYCARQYLAEDKNHQQEEAVWQDELPP